MQEMLISGASDDKIHQEEEQRVQLLCVLNNSGRAKSTLGP